MKPTSKEGIEDVLGTVARLRAPGGCAWDQKQTHKTLEKYLIEECAEVLEALDSGNDAALEEELGDLLLQVLMHAQIASERGAFDFASIAAKLNAKLIFRHPHVFGGQTAPEDDQAFWQQWERLKAQEREAKGEAAKKDSIQLPPKLPALSYAAAVVKAFKKAQKVVDLSEAEDCAADSEMRLAARLFECVGACQQAGIDPEGALRRYAAERAKAL